MELSISNPLLLQCLFSNIQAEGISLKDLRLVSKQWNKAILALPKPRIQLILNNPQIPNVDDPEVFINFSNNVNPKLTRSIRVLNRVELNTTPLNPSQVLPDSQHEWSLEAVGYLNLMQCIENFSRSINVIELADIKIDFVCVLHQLLQKHCPNLTKVALTVDSIPEENDERGRPPHVSQTWRDADFTIILTNNGSIPIKQKLQTIHVALDESHSQPPIRSTIGPLHDLFCFLVQASPNLLEIRQTIICFPDCSKSMQIKSFDFRLPFYQYDFNPKTGALNNINFTLEPLARMISQMAYSLEFLNLEMCHTYCRTISEKNNCSCPDTLAFVMPRIKNLKVFKCSDTSIFFRDEETFKNINAIHDTLQHISIGRQINRHSTGVGQFVTGICSVACRSAQVVSNNLTSLTINGICTLGPLFDLQFAFPSLGKLGINTNFGVCDYQTDKLGNSQESCLLAQTLRIAHVLKLERVNCTIPLPSSFLTFVGVMDHYAPFFRSRRIKSLRITGNRSRMTMIAAEDEAVMQQLQLAVYAMRRMDSVKIISNSIIFPASIGQDFFDFIDDNSLPVEFITLQYA